MNTEIFFQKIRSYSRLSSEAEDDWRSLLDAKTYLKDSAFLHLGEVPQKVGFVVKGLLAQYFVSPEGDSVIKHFFPEGRIAGSIPATLTKTESLSGIAALEDTLVFEYDFYDFKGLVSKHKDIAEFYIRYMERHWIIEKEPEEVSLRSDTAKTRYEDFLNRYPDLVKRLKKHQVAAYLGITPTQLSRIFGARR